MIKVRARDNEPLDKMLRRFKRKCDNEGLIRDMKKATIYEKPSEVKRKKQRKRMRKIRRAAMQTAMW